MHFDSKFGDDNFVDDIGTVSSKHSKSWLTKALRKVLKVSPPHNSSKPITRDVIDDQSLMMASSNGFQNASDVEENVQTESDNSHTGRNEIICSRTCDGETLENNVVIHEKSKSCKKSDKINVPTKKKSSIGRDSNPISQPNEYSKSVTRKRFVIPSLVITKVETLDFNEDDDEYDSS